MKERESARCCEVIRQQTSEVTKQQLAKVQTRAPFLSCYMYCPNNTSDKRSSFLPSVLGFFYSPATVTDQWELRGAAAIHTDVIMVTAPSFILPFKTQLALFTAVISIFRLTARTQISHTANRLCRDEGKTPTHIYTVHCMYF